MLEYHCVITIPFCIYTYIENLLKTLQNKHSGEEACM